MTGWIWLDVFEAALLVLVCRKAWRTAQRVDAIDVELALLKRKGVATSRDLVARESAARGIEIWPPRGGVLR